MPVVAVDQVAVAVSVKPKAEFWQVLRAVVDGLAMVGVLMVTVWDNVLVPPQPEPVMVTV